MATTYEVILSSSEPECAHYCHFLIILYPVLEGTCHMDAHFESELGSKGALHGIYSISAGSNWAKTCEIKVLVENQPKK